MTLKQAIAKGKRKAVADKKRQAKVYMSAVNTARIWAKTHLMEMVAAAVSENRTYLTIYATVPPSLEMRDRTLHEIIEDQGFEVDVYPSHLILKWDRVCE
jgi:5-deoxy-D-glucuronate isomerase